MKRIVILILTITLLIIITKEKVKAGFCTEVSCGCQPGIPCPNSCSIEKNLVKCKCSEEYEGKFCQNCAKGHFRLPNLKTCKKINEACSTLKCQNGGTCDLDKGTCVCPKNYAGNTCQHCSSGYAGKTCQLVMYQKKHIGTHISNSFIAISILSAICILILFYQFFMSEDAIDAEGWRDFMIADPQNNERQFEDSSDDPMAELFERVVVDDQNEEQENKSNIQYIPNNKTNKTTTTTTTTTTTDDDEEEENIIHLYAPKTPKQQNNQTTEHII